MENTHHEASTDATTSTAPDSPGSRAPTPRLTDRSTALRWAGTFVDVQDCERLTSRPWAKTYRLTHGGGSAYLKVLNPVLAPSVAATARLSKRFPDTVPTVVAADVEQGLLLTSEHGGRAYGRQPGEERRTRLLASYAAIQSRSAGDPELVGAVPTLRIDTLVDDLMAFLEDDLDAVSVQGARVSARYFLSGSRCRQYVFLLRPRAELLKRFLSTCTSLPYTINHGDLRPSNVAEDASGQPLLYDWDEAVAGPAGLSLHAMFSGSSTLLEVLRGSSLLNHPEQLRQPQREIERYLQTLAREGYASIETLRESVAAAAVAGMLYYIVGFSRFPRDSRSYRRTVRRNIKKRMSDVLDVCDVLCLSGGSEVTAYARNYADAARGWRAERLLGAHLEQQPMNADAWALLGTLLRERGRLPRSVRAFGRSLAVEPDNAAVLVELGTSHTRQGEFLTALEHLHKSLLLREDQATREYFERVSELHQLAVEADKPGTVPTVTFSPQEKSNARFSPETLMLCETLFRKHGALLMKEVFPSYFHPNGASLTQ